MARNRAGAGAFAARTEVGPTSHRTPAGSLLASATWSAWSCEVRVVLDDPRAIEAAEAHVRALMDRVERAASRFVTESDLQWANANAGRPTAVPRVLIDLVDAALVAARASDGALDPTIGRHLARAGYDRDILLVQDDETIPAPPQRSGRNWRDVRLDRAAGLLTVPRGTALDLGATAKAQTADWAASQLHARHRCGVLVEIGGDLAVAGGSRDWQVTVAERAGAEGQRIAVHRGGVATSTTTVRTWRRGTDRMHHIIDPLTGRSASGPWRTVSVATESALAANACATAAIVMGAGAEAWLTSRGVAARLVDQRGGITTVGGWPPLPTQRVRPAGSVS